MRGAVKPFVKDKAGRGCDGKRADQIAPARSHRIEAEAHFGCHLHQTLHGEGDRRPRDAAIGRHRAGIGGSHRASETHSRGRRRVRGSSANAISGSTPQVTGIAGVGTDIGERYRRCKASSLPFCVEGAFEPNALVAAVEGGHQVLAAILDPCHRAAAVCAPARPAAHIPARSDIFWPKPPPTSGATTRRSASANTENVARRRAQ